MLKSGGMIVPSTAKRMTHCTMANPGPLVFAVGFDPRVEIATMAPDESAMRRPPIPRSMREVAMGPSFSICSCVTTALAVPARRRRSKPSKRVEYTAPPMTRTPARVRADGVATTV